MSVHMFVYLSVCLSRLDGEGAEGDREGGQEGGRRWRGGISMMECQAGHTFPEQRWVT